MTLVMVYGLKHPQISGASHDSRHSTRRQSLDSFGHMKNSTAQESRIAGIQLHDVSFTFKNSKTPALTVDHLQMAPGDLTAIVGASGSGKTTLLNLAAGLLTPQRGSVHVNGYALHKASDSKRAKFRRAHCDVIFQDFALIESLTAAENLMLAAKLAGEPCNDALVTDALASVGLSDFGGRRTWELSGGQQQRVAIARTLVKSGQVVLADEPTSALDDVSTRIVIDALRNFAHVNKKTVVIVTHDRDVAACADRVISVSDGRVVRDVVNERIASLPNVPMAGV